MDKYVILSLIFILTLLSFSCSRNMDNNTKNLLPEQRQAASDNTDPAKGITQIDNQDSRIWKEKVSSELLFQIYLKQKQIAAPSEERLKQMKFIGMEIQDFTKQKIFMYLHQQLTPEQIAELQKMNVVIYLDSWLPPVGVFPTGYYVVLIPISELATLASKEYIVKLDTAERILKPMDKPQ